MWAPVLKSLVERELRQPKRTLTGESHNERRGTELQNGYPAITTMAIECRTTVFSPRKQNDKRVHR